MGAHGLPGIRTQWEAVIPEQGRQETCGWSGGHEAEGSGGRCSWLWAHTDTQTATAQPQIP